MSTRTWTFATLDEHKQAEHEMLDAARYAALEHGAVLEELDAEMGRVRVCLEEALVNHLKHGNQLDSSKSVTCAMTLTPGPEGVLVAFDSKDEGEGFDPDTLPDPTEPENIEKSHGRGVHIIRKMAKAAEYLERGTRLRMEFLLKSRPLKPEGE